MHAVLGVLLDGEHGAHGLTVQLTRRLPGVRPLSSGQLHATLRDASGRGWVIRRGPERRRVYVLTDAGRREFDAWSRSPLLVRPTTHDDILIRIVFVGPREPALLLRALEDHQAELALVTVARRPDPGRDERAQMTELARQLAAIRAEGEIQGLTHVIEELRARVGRPATTPVPESEPWVRQRGRS